MIAAAVITGAVSLGIGYLGGSGSEEAYEWAKTHVKKFNVSSTKQSF